MKNKIERKPLRQGDVILKPVDVIKGEEQKQDKIVLAYGEVTGHSHQITQGAGQLFKWNEKHYLKITSEYALLRHEEHHEVKIPQGDYEVIIQEEWQEDGWSKVFD